MPARVLRGFLLIGPSFAEKRVWFSQELPNFLQKYVAYTILSRKTCDGEQTLFLRINLHINAHKGNETIFCWLGGLLLKNVYDFRQELSNILQNMLLTLFYLERHVDGEQILFLRINLHVNAHKGYLDNFSWLHRLLLKKRVWFRQELPNFLQKYVAYTILSRKTCNGEQKLFFRINLHINCPQGYWEVFCWLDPLLLKNVYDLAKKFQIFFKNMLLTLFYLEKTCDGEQKLFLGINLHVNAPQGYLDDFCWLDRLLLKNVYDLAKYFQIFFKNMLLTLFYLERHVMESKYYFWELIFMLMPTMVSRRFLLIGPSFAEKRVWFSQELPNFLQKYVAYTILSRKTCNGEQKIIFEN